MPEEIYRQICEGTDVRNGLIALRAGMKDEKYKRRLAYAAAGDLSVFIRLLSDEDPKIRKNAALILGQMETEDVLPFLFDAYEKETTLFIRADYLKAMENLDLGPWTKRLRRDRDQLVRRQFSEEEQKHVHEERVWLEKLLSRYEKPERHAFAMPAQPEETPDTILVTGPLLRELTANQVTTGEVTFLHSGIRVHRGLIPELLKIRTYSQMLFPIRCERLGASDPSAVGQILGTDGVLSLSDRLTQPLRERDESAGRQDCFHYRMDVRGMDQEAKGRFIRRCTASLDQAAGGRLINDPADYEMEIRLLLRKDGTLQPLLRLTVLPDERFVYRKEYLPDSLTCEHAALAVELARPWLKPTDQIIDPFCGVGTLLIERKYAMGSADAYGIDIREEAVKKARVNTAITGMRIHYINRDAFSFRHEYPFDEVITQLPAYPSDPEKEKDLHRRFLNRMPLLMGRQAVLAVCTMQPQLLIRLLQADSRYQILAKERIHAGSGLSEVVIGYQA